MKLYAQTPVKLPAVRRAVALMFQDQGMYAPRTYVLPNYGSARPQIIDWRRVERFLSRLSRSELETFAVGDQDDQVALMRARKDGAYAHAALDSLFEEIGA